jgi:uncharacterized protein
MRAIWAGFGFLAVALGAIGIVTPFLPTVPFLLLAAFCFARSSARLHDWLLGHPTFGPPIRNWQSSGAISRRAKWLASASILAGFALSVFLGLGWKVLAAQAIVLGLTALFIWTRPDR